MNAKLGWLLALAAVVLGWLTQGWAGLVLALTVIVFWLLLQFGRAVRVMKNAAAAPKGRVKSAVMLHSKLHSGMTLMQILGLTGSLGQPHSAAGSPAIQPSNTEQFSWMDDSGAQVLLTLRAGKLSAWQLERPDAQASTNSSGQPGSGS